MNSSGFKIMRPMLFCQRQQLRRLISTTTLESHKYNKMPLISSTAVLREKRKGKDVSF